MLQNYVSSGSGPFSQNSFDTRIDYAATSSLSVFGRFSLDYFSLSGKGSLGALGGPGTGLLGLSGSSITHNYSLATGFTKTLSTSLLTDVRFRMVQVQSANPKARWRHSHDWFRNPQCKYQRSEDRWSGIIPSGFRPEHG